MENNCRPVPQNHIELAKSFWRLCTNLLGERLSLLTFDWHGRNHLLHVFKCVFLHVLRRATRCIKRGVQTHAQSVVAVTRLWSQNV
ncbi:hypothetical protein FKM82_014517 [Ascaphus truei]